MVNSPRLEYRQVINDSGDPGYVNRVLVATPTTGLVRMEWVAARYGQIIPTNWSMVQYQHFMDGFIPLRYQVSDAQNLIVQMLVEKDFQWLLLIEHDTILPPDAFIRFNEYMISAEAPVVSGLYFTRSRPSEPLIYRGRGTGSFRNFSIGDRVWCDGVPTGCLLVHGGLLKSMWEESEEYQLYGQTVRRVFDTPRKAWFDPESKQFNTTSGTSDLDWCTRVMEEDFFAKSGWHGYTNDKYPFLVDTNIFCKHINPNGEQFP